MLFVSYSFLILIRGQNADNFFSEAFSESEELPLSYRFLKISFYMAEFFIFVVVIRPRSHNVSSRNHFFLCLENYFKTLFFIDIPSRWLCSMKRTWLFFCFVCFLFYFFVPSRFISPLQGEGLLQGLFPSCLVHVTLSKPLSPLPYHSISRGKLYFFP